MSDPRQKISDGYHTFEELYEHRILLYFALVLHAPSSWKKAWKPHYSEWPVLFLETPIGQISYHFHEKYLHLIEKEVPRDDIYVWDVHDSADVIERLTEVLTGNAIV